MTTTKIIHELEGDTFIEVIASPIAYKVNKCKGKYPNDYDKKQVFYSRGKLDRNEIEKLSEESQKRVMSENLETGMKIARKIIGGGDE